MREELIQASRADLIGDDRDCLIGPKPSKEVIEARLGEVNNAVRGDHHNSVANPARARNPANVGSPPKLTSYRPGRKSATRRKTKAGEAAITPHSSSAVTPLEDATEARYLV